MGHSGEEGGGGGRRRGGGGEEEGEGEEEGRGRRRRRGGGGAYTCTLYFTFHYTAKFILSRLYLVFSVNTGELLCLCYACTMVHAYIVHRCVDVCLVCVHVSAAFTWMSYLNTSRWRWS